MCNLRNIFLRHVKKVFTSCQYFLTFILTYEVIQNLRDVKIIYGLENMGWV